MTSPYDEGFKIAIAGGRRSDNPYARGWSRVAALVMPESFAEQWDRGFTAGLKYHGDVARVVKAVINEEDVDGH